MSKKINKTNAVRILDQNKVDYELVEYPVDENDLSGIHVAEEMGEDPDQIFKTIVLKGTKNGHFVCCIPVAETVDLKKAAKAFGDKKADTIPLRELLPTTGYIRGGCSPIGMKKDFPTYIDETAILFDTIAISGGKRGLQIFLNPEDLKKVCNAEFVDLTLD